MVVNREISLDSKRKMAWVEIDMELGEVAVTLGIICYFSCIPQSKRLKRGSSLRREELH